MKSSRPNTSKDTFLYNPGPGNYSYLQNNRTKSASFKMSKTDRFFDTQMNELVKNPGPQNYFPLAPGKTDPKWGFGTFTRNPKKLTREIIPGPGAYNVSVKIGEGQKNAFTSRIDDSKFTLKTPGPNVYNTANAELSFKNKASSWNFGKSKKDDLYNTMYKKNVPGPGNNSIKTSFQGGPSIKYGKTNKFF